MTNPNPGSDAAVAQGCTCPVLDNAHGEGVMLNGEITHWISHDCPLHGCDCHDYEENDHE